MYAQDKKIIVQFLFVVFSATLVTAQEPAITLSELREIIKDSQESLTTAHLVYVEEVNDSRTPDGDKNSLKYKVNEMSKHRRLKVDTILNYSTKSLKSALTDLRDIDILLKERNIPIEQKSVVSWSRSLVIQPPYEMELLGIDVSNGNPDLLLSELGGRTRYIFSLIHLGIINEQILSEESDATLSEINSGGKSLLRIELVKDGQSSLKRTIDFDPTLG